MEEIKSASVCVAEIFNRHMVLGIGYVCNLLHSVKKKGFPAGNGCNAWHWRVLYCNYPISCRQVEISVQTHRRFHQKKQFVSIPL